MSKKYIKNHDEWNRLKKILDEIGILLPFEEREIWWAALGANIGIEIEGKGEYFERPILIIKKLNREHAWILPLTHISPKREGYHIYIFHENLQENSSVVISQLQTISGKRLLRYIGTLSLSQFEVVIECTKEFLVSQNVIPPKNTKDLT